MFEARNHHNALINMLTQAGVAHRTHMVCDAVDGTIHGDYQRITLAIGSDGSGPVAEFSFSLEGKLEDVAVFGSEP